MFKFFKQRKNAIHLGVWLSLVLLGILIFSLYFPFRLVLIHALSNGALSALLFYFSVWLVNQYVEKGRTLTALLIGFLPFWAICALRTGINMALLDYFPVEKHSQQPFSPFWRVTALVIATSGFVVLFAAVMQLLINRYRREEAQQLLIQEQQVAQLNFLKAQINPHFLFNALNNIYSLTVTQSKEAPEMLLKLSDLLRYAIYEGQKNAVPLSLELKHIRNFIELFQMRNETPVDIRFDVSGDTQPSIEPMILIPLVENCFKHCDFELNPAAKALIRLDISEKQLHFHTQNTFNRTDIQKDETGGVGLANIARRLELRYPDAHEFSFGEKGDWFEVDLRLTPSPIEAPSSVPHLPQPS